LHRVLLYFITNEWLGICIWEQQLSHRLSTNPAHLAGLRFKGLTEKDMDADLVVS
jgi:hypothetical protein